MGRIKQDVVADVFQPKRDKSVYVLFSLIRLESGEVDINALPKSA